ncbi:MAG TPA: alpha-galactosidase [Candidatus Angelobacter sp.]|nr:alpha-galactosidase [Candidatus Angelobacter sp.]
MLQKTLKVLFPLLLLGFAALASQAVAAQARHSRLTHASQPDLISKMLTETPFSFVYGGKPSQQLLTRWIKNRVRQKLPDGNERRLVTYRDPQTGLEIIDEMTIYKGFSAVDWVLRLRNSGDADTPVIENLLPLDLRFAVPVNDSPVFHSAHGSSAKPDDFLPIRKILTAGESYSFEHYYMQGGRQAATGFPYFDVHWENGGIVGAIGWTGQWVLQIHRGFGNEVTLRAGQETTHFKLHPGEIIRTPRILLLQWEGRDHLEGHNQFRHLLISYYVPKVNGKVAMDPVSHTGAYVLLFDGIARKMEKNPLDVLPRLHPSDLNHAHGLPTPDDALNYVNEKNQLALIRGMPQVGIEAYWLDAGWFKGGWPFGAGNWAPDRKKFPLGLKPLGVAVHERGIKFILWFEPKRVAPGTFIAKQHPEWILHIPGEGKWGGIFNLGALAARQWMTQLLSQRIQDWGVDIYRNDSNICPLPFWRAADEPDRQGITEIRDVEGLYKLWDGLLKSHPGLLIDNANWRITGPDIEVMKRSIGSLTRSEVDDSGLPYPVLDQAETAELNLWVPLDSTIVHGLDPYTFRSAATTGVAIGLDLQSRYIPLDELRTAIEEVKSLRPFWLGDYYPLSSIDADPARWCAWQFNRADLGAGFAMLFRRPECPETIFYMRLRGLDPHSRYQVSFAESYRISRKRIMTGAELTRLRVQISSAPGSLLLRYKKIEHSNSRPL